MRPKVSWDERTVQFVLVDLNGAGVKPEFVQYWGGLTVIQAHTMAASHWDNYEERSWPGMPSV